LFLASACSDEPAHGGVLLDAAIHAASEGGALLGQEAGAAYHHDAGLVQTAHDASDAAAEHAHDAGPVHHACATPYFVDPRDKSASGAPVRLVTQAGDPANPADDQYDLQVPADLKAWMDEQNWGREHANWHNVRRWDTDKTPPILAARGLTRSPILEGQDGDGFAFMAMHRHMIQGLRQAFPSHFTAIRAFSHVPLEQTDAQNPFPYKGIEWSDAQLATLDILEHIEQHADEFLSDDDLGHWIQFLRVIPPSGGGGDAGASAEEEANATALGGIHLALHAQFAIPDSPFSLLDNEANLYLVSFWQLHGWIDNVWSRYRLAKGLRDDDPVYQAELLAQCEEMHGLDDKRVDTRSDDAGTAVVEVGEFATRVAPILQTYCRGCHGVETGQAGLVLTGLPASQVRTNLVGVRANEADLALVEPGAPQQSWLVRKLTGDFHDIACGDCKTMMPLAGARPSAQELATVQAWIAGGATDR
jgi:hypothetical protein